MPADPEKPTPSSTLDEAIAWHMRLRDSMASPSIMEEFRTWKHAAPENAAAYTQALQFWQNLDHARPAVLEHFSNDVEDVLKASPQNDPWFERFGAYLDGFRFTFLHARYAALAASLVLIAFIAIQNIPYQDQRVTYATARGEISQVNLRDGSSLVLNADTKISVRYHRRSRDVDLLQGGAVFDVAHNQKRPFTVHAADSKVTVLGTRFEVDLTPDNIKVAVARGLVGVASDARQKTNTAYAIKLKPGEQSNHLIGQEKYTRSTIDPTQIGSWQDHVLVFDNATLKDSVNRLNRHFAKGALALAAEPDIAKIRLSGVFKAITPEASAAQLAQLLSLDVQINKDTYVLQKTSDISPDK